MGATASAKLKRFYGPRHSFSVLLPNNWKFRNASYPSDHSTYFYYDPHDAFAKLEIVGSGCVGCVMKSDIQGTPGYEQPNPSGELPQYATVTSRPNQYVESFNVFDTPYEDDGMVIVTHSGTNITGSVIVQLWLSKKEQTEAAQILSSLEVVGA